MKKYIQEEKFKAEGLKMMDRLKSTEKMENKQFCAMQVTIRFKGVLIAPIEEVWNADS